jgi:hypothetical protein
MREKNSLHNFTFIYIFDKIGIETKGYLRKHKFLNKKGQYVTFQDILHFMNINCLHYVNFHNFFGRD